MSRIENKVQLIGHTGDEIKMHYFEGGGSIGRLSLATNSSYKNKTTGEKVTKTQWHNLVFRNKAAELIEKYVKKGHKLAVEGSLEYRKWQDNDGNDRWSTEINVYDFLFMEKSGGDGQSGGQSTTETKPASDQQNTAQQPTPPVSEEDDDLPF